MRANRRGVMVKKAVAVLGFLVISTTAGRVFGQPPWGERGAGLPPEAIQACEGKSSGDTVQFQTPRGDTITGTCREMQGRLVAVPEGGSRGRHRGGPPPEAIQACEGKSSGDTVQFQTPRGDTITGTCREMQGRLVAVPQK